jgi:hypothetical protein
MRTRANNAVSEAANIALKSSNSAIAIGRKTILSAQGTLLHVLQVARN